MKRFPLCLYMTAKAQRATCNRPALMWEILGPRLLEKCVKNDSRQLEELNLGEWMENSRSNPPINT